MLTSVHNPRVRWVRALQDKRRAREDERRFVLEGVRLVEVALDAGVQPEVAFYTADLTQSERGAALLARLREASETVEVNDAVLRAMSATETPQGVVAVLPYLTKDEGRRSVDDRQWTMDAVTSDVRPSSLVLRLPSLLLVVDGVRDPGNLGTLLRGAAAAGVTEVLLAPGTVDLYNPKTVRAGMGAHFHVAVQPLEWDVIQVRLTGLAVRLAAMDGERPYYAVDWTGPSALVIGSEAEGVSVDARTLARVSVSIPMRPGVESLNAAMAATVILFEAARQRGLEIRDGVSC